MRTLLLICAAALAPGAVLAQEAGYTDKSDAIAAMKYVKEEAHLNLGNYLAKSFFEEYRLAYNAAVEAYEVSDSIWYSDCQAFNAVSHLLAALTTLEEKAGGADPDLTRILDGYEDDEGEYHPGWLQFTAWAQYYWLKECRD